MTDNNKYITFEKYEDSIDSALKTLRMTIQQYQDSSIYSVTDYSVNCINNKYMVKVIIFNKNTQSVRAEEKTRKKQV